MRGVVILVAVSACGPGIKQADTRDVGRDVLAEASGDASALAKLLQGSVVDAGLYFAEATCATQFGAAREIAASELSAFASCLAGLHLQPSPRRDALGDVVVMTYAPGFEIEARVTQELSGARLSWIGFEARRGDADDLPMITKTALETLRIDGDPNGPLDAGAGSVLLVDREHDVAFTWIKLCLDESGSVRSAHPYQTTSEAASRVFVAAASGWHFRPFTIDDHAMAACAMVRMAYPPQRAPKDETLPLPPPPSREGKREPIVFAPGFTGAKFVEGKRIQGTKLVAPDLETRKAMKARGLDKVIGSFRICLDEAGHVEQVMPLRSTGSATYDRELLAAMSQWVYSPYLAAGEAVPVCTAVTFVYSIGADQLP